MSTKPHDSRTAIYIALIGALTSVAVAWISAITSAKPAARTAVAEKTDELQSLQSDVRVANAAIGKLSESVAMQSLVPKGGIIAWHARDGKVPEGWAICNGDNGTPNLVGKFLKGVGTQTESGIDPDGHASHTHLVALNASGDTVRYTTDQGNDSIGVIDTGHTHTAQATAASNIPPNYAVVFIMKL